MQRRESPKTSDGAQKKKSSKKIAGLTERDVERIVVSLNNDRRSLAWILEHNEQGARQKN